MASCKEAGPDPVDMEEVPQTVSELITRLKTISSIAAKQFAEYSELSEDSHLLRSSLRRALKRSRQLFMILRDKYNPGTRLPNWMRDSITGKNPSNLSMMIYWKITLLSSQRRPPRTYKKQWQKLQISIFTRKCSMGQEPAARRDYIACLDIFDLWRLREWGNIISLFSQIFQANKLWIIV